MKRKILLNGLLFIFATVSLVNRAAAKEVTAGVCTLSHAAGNYGFSDSGTIVGIGPRAAVGTLAFDAAGSISGKLTASLSGSIGTTSLSGTYSVNSDCSGSAVFSESDESGTLILTATVEIVWDDSMREARFLFTSVKLATGIALAPVVNGDARRLIP